MENGERRNPDAPVPFSHVRHDPVAFSFEPIPGGSNGLQKPAATKPFRPTNDAAALYGEAALNEIRNTFGNRDRVNGSDSTELKYLELAAAEKARRNQTSMPRTDDLYDHWLVKEAENQRLSDQLKAERLARERQEGRKSSDLDYKQLERPYQYQYPNSASVNQSRFEPEYSYEVIDQPIVSDDLSNRHRPPSPKFPSDSVLKSKYGLSLDLDDDNRIIAVSDRQICAHCGTELGTLFSPC